MGCSSGLFSVHKMDIQQGNYEVEMNGLELEMDKDDVRRILGSPAIQDPFHANQWTYVNQDGDRLDLGPGLSAGRVVVLIWGTGSKTDRKFAGHDSDWVV